MHFADKLNNLMRELDLSQTKLSELTGISKPNISQYLHGKHEPSNERKKEIAHALGVQEDYFRQFEPVAEITAGCINLKTEIAAKLLHKSKNWVEQGLKNGVFPWGYAVKLKKWSYFINAKKFSEIEGIKLPLNKVADDALQLEGSI